MLSGNNKPRDYKLFGTHHLTTIKEQSIQLQGKSLAIEMPNISTGLVSKYHYSGDVALKRIFNKPEKESII